MLERRKISSAHNNLVSEKHSGCLQTTGMWYKKKVLKEKKHTAAVCFDVDKAYNTVKAKILFSLHNMDTIFPEKYVTTESYV